MNENDSSAVTPRPLLNEGGPWGGGGSGGDGGDGSNPWNQPPRGRPGRGPAGRSALDELLRRGRARFGGRDGPEPEAGRMILWAVGGILLLWVLWTSSHRIDPQERGVITRLGSYAGTLGPGMRFSFPAPIDHVTKIDIEEIRVRDIPAGGGNAQNLMLTGDQNMIDLAYSVRWNIRDPELYLYELADPEDTVGEVAESAMRAEIARVALNDAMGSQRSQIEGRVQQRMQEILDSYRAGITVQGVAIKQADPPTAVVEAFKSVSAAQQQAQAYLNEARAYAQQLGAKAEGEAAAFDKVYAEYKLAPEVTRRRMYYETMERVLAKTDKTIVEAPNVVPYVPLPQPPRAQGGQQ
ncbi:peptidase [Sphingomonas sp. Root710]|uniref:FtsH protease activity modulator HflK n=1 Tax=Sphingomonas sp. Root710 TaxID=1736594 RepID=UPI0006F7C3E0|nr:FtsH protease activity modulator HflK [Sphingomonas sp. Root710]KRB83080.1 peptidase [Sphingomonas sp. Root710]